MEVRDDEVAGPAAEPERPADRLVRLTTLDELVALTVTTHGMYLRYSPGPAADAADCRSRDRGSGVDMPGLTVTPLSPEPWWPRSAEEWVARRLHRSCGLDEERGNFPWLLTGTVIGHSLDLEPLVVQFRPLARIDQSVLDEAARVYDRFGRPTP